MGNNEIEWMSKSGFGKLENPNFSLELKGIVFVATFAARMRSFQKAVGYLERSEIQSTSEVFLAQKNFEQLLEALCFSAAESIPRWNGCLPVQNQCHEGQKFISGCDATMFHVSSSHSKQGVFIPSFETSLFL